MQDVPASADPNKPPAGPYVLSVYPADSDREITLADLWRVIEQGKWILVCSAAICAILAGIAAFWITPIYRAEVLMAPVSEDESQQGLAALAGQLGGFASLAGVRLDSGAGSTARAVATLRSRALTEAFIREHDLISDLRPRENGAPDNSSNGEARDDSLAMWEALKKFDKIRTVAEDAETGLITLTIDWTDPEDAALWANELIDAVNLRLRTDAIQQAEDNLEFLEVALQDQSAVELRSAVFSLIEAEMKNAMFANVRADYAFDVIDPAVPPEERIKPKRRLIVLLGFVAGLALSFLVILVRSSIASGGRSSAQRDSL